MPNSSTILSQRLKLCREQQGETLDEIGVLVGVNRSTVLRWERGETARINLPTLERLASHFGVSPAWLAGKSDISDMDFNNTLQLPDNIISLPTASRHIPLLGTIACGVPILAAENIDEMVPVPDFVHADFALRCQGDSMAGARILDGDIVYIRKQPDVENGEIAAVLIDCEATLKRVYKSKGGLILQPENPQYQPIMLVGQALEDVRILGKAVYFVSGVR